MTPAGLLFVAGLAAADPTGPAVPAPRLSRGDELVYVGDVLEAGERLDNRFRKHASLTVKVFVLEAKPGATDAAVVTTVQPLLDPLVVGAAKTVTGRQAAAGPPVVRVALVRVDGRGRVRVLLPPGGPPPLPLGPDTLTGPVPPLVIDAPPPMEVGMFVPLPAGPAGVGSTWEGDDGTTWTAGREGVWNGGRVVELAAAHRGPGWTRLDRVASSPTDGVACRVHRTVERYDGRDVVGWVTVKYELQPPTRYLGRRYVEARQAVETAYGFAAALPEAANTPAFARYQGRLAQYLAEADESLPYYDAVAAVERRYQAVANGAAVPVEAKPEPPAVGRPAPDFTAPLLGSGERFRLSSVRGKPAVLVFVRPGSELSAKAVATADALHRRFADRAAVVCLTVGVPAAVADRHRAAWGVTVPVADGTSIRTGYEIDTHPRFFVIDAAGTLRLRFDGWGPEAGHLVSKEVARLAK